MAKGGSRVGAGRKGKLRDPQDLLRVVPVPAAPSELGEREQRCWKRLAGEVDPLEIFTAADGSSFLSLVRTEALLEAALAGEATDVDRDGSQKRPSISAITGLVRTAAMLRQRFRLDPASRGAVAAPPRTLAPMEDDKDDIRPLPPWRPAMPS